MAPEIGTGAGAAPDFERLIALERAAGRTYRRAALLLLLLGLVLAAAGLASRPASASLLVPGLLAAALTALPWREALERRDRAEGLEVLQAEWLELAPEPPGGRERLLALIEAMFGRKPTLEAGA